jgi:DNA-binding CsgD family transcriptional regulator
MTVAASVVQSTVERVDVSSGDGLQLCGRAHEGGVLNVLLGGLRAGRAGVLVLQGEAGIGKTALLEHVELRADGIRLVQVSAVRSEVDLPYAALHQLCVPLLDQIERLPDPQRAALATAFGVATGIPPDRLCLGLAILGLLSRAADADPLLCVVDDAQWLDAESASVLGFVSRRLAAEPVALMFATREPVRELAGLPELQLRGLADRDARALFSSTLRGPFDKRVRERIVVESRGNPRALLELSRAFTPMQLAGGFGDPDVGALTIGVEENRTDEVEALPDELRLFLLVAAAEPLGEPWILLRAAHELSLPPTMAGTLQERGLLNVGSRVQFPDPLVRWAIYRSASAYERQRVHGALADATDGGTEPEWRAWHRAYAATAPDEDVAADLERSAKRVLSIGGFSAVAAFLSRSAALTPELTRLAWRWLAAAEAEQQAGDSDAAQRTLAAAEAGPLGVGARARAQLLWARMAVGSGTGDASAQLLAAARALEPLDIDLARDTYLETLAAIVEFGSREEHDLVEVCDSAMAANRQGPPRPTDMLLDGVALQVTKGWASAVPTLRRALAAFAGGHGGLGGCWLASHVASALWEPDLERALAERLVHLSKQVGALGVVPQALAQLAATHVRQGSFAAADLLIGELELAVDPRDATPAARVKELLAAFRGQATDRQSLIEAPWDGLTPAVHSLTETTLKIASMVLNNALGRYEDALREGRGLVDAHEWVITPAWALPELVEAAVRVGSFDDASRALGLLAERARVSETDQALGLRARSQALMSEGEAAEALYRESLFCLGRAGGPFDLARAHLLYGEWLRRERRRIDAREQLRTAHRMFDAIGAEAFAERARRELVATGERARKRSVETLDDLTAQEIQVARMARDGLSNPEIGARLFISARTVKYHLQKVFTKLGISSRHELGRVLPREPDEALIA